MKKRVLVCGASGFIGRNLFQSFSARQDLEVYGTYLKNNTHSQLELSHHLQQADLTDNNWAKVVTKGMDMVINAAATTDGYGAIAASTDPSSYIDDNIRINNNLIRAAHLNKVSHFIFISCSVLYPGGNIPLKEEEADIYRTHPKYRMGAEMKVFFEDLCRYYSGLNTTKYTIIRPGNLYGSYDKFDLKRGHVLAANIEKVMTAKNQIIVWGDGQERRDFIYIQDFIDFVNKAIEKQQAKYEIFNVANGKTYSVKELVEKIIKISGKKLEIDYDTSKPSIHVNITMNISKAFNVLGWKPNIDLEEGLRQTIRWYLNNKAGSDGK